MPARKNRKKDMVESSDGWSTVVSGPPSRPADMSSSAADEGGDDEFMNISYDNLKKKYQQLKAELELTQSWTDIKRFLDGSMMPIVRPVKGGPLRLKKCVVLGLGSTVSFRGHKNSLFQLALFHLIADHMGWAEELAQGGALLAQDPVFHDLDIQLLEDTLGFQVVNDPEGFEEVDEDTFLYAPHLEDIYNQLAVRKWPFWAFVNDLDRYSPFGAVARNLRHTEALAMDHGLMTAYAKEHHSFKFPYSNKVADGRAFNDCAFYWRRGPRKTPVPSTGGCDPAQISGIEEPDKVDNAKENDGLLTAESVQSASYSRSLDNGSDRSDEQGGGLDEDAPRLTYKQKGKAKAEVSEMLDTFDTPREVAFTDGIPFEISKEEQMRLDEEFARQLQEEESRMANPDPAYQNISGRPQGISEQEWNDRLLALEVSNEHEPKFAPQTLKKAAIRFLLDDDDSPENKQYEICEKADAMEMDSGAEMKMPSTPMLTRADTQLSDKSASSDG